MAGNKDATFAGQFLALIFNGASIANLADNTATSPATTFYFSLHRSDPGPTGNQTTNEIGYAGYARMAVPRTTSYFHVAGNSVQLRNPVDFPAVPASQSFPATYFAVGLAATGTGRKLYSGPILPLLPLRFNLPVRLVAGTFITEN